MTTVTIPKEITKRKDLIAVPRSQYEEFLRWQKKIKSARTFMPTAREKKLLAQSRKAYARKEYLTLEEVRHELDFNR